MFKNGVADVVRSGRRRRRRRELKSLGLWFGDYWPKVLLMIARVTVEEYRLNGILLIFVDVVYENPRMSARFIYFKGRQRGSGFNSRP
jgi:hypothetical protein